MARSPHTYPRLKLAPDFREAILSKRRETGMRFKILAMYAGFPDTATFSDQLYSDGFPYTALSCTRWRSVADFLSYTKTILIDAEPLVSVPRRHEEEMAATS